MNQIKEVKAREKISIGFSNRNGNKFGNITLKMISSWLNLSYSLRDFNLADFLLI